MKKKRDTVDFSNLLANKRVPIVILDERWHKLFQKTPKSARVTELERKLNDLMKQQGKLVADVKSLKTAKQQLMGGIMANMNVDSSPEGKLNGKKLQKSQKLIQDINLKLKNTDNDLAEIPYKIKEANARLVVEGMNQCYQKMDANSNELAAVTQRMEQLREELKQLIVKKQDMEEENTVIYSYMHDVLGSDVMELLDQHYKKR